MIANPGTENGIAKIPRINSFAPTKKKQNAKIKINCIMTPRQITNDNTTARKAIASGVTIGAAQIARQAIQKRLHFDDF